MRYSTVLLSLLPVCLAFPSVARQEQSKAPQVLSTVKDLNGAVVDLTTAVNNFDGYLLDIIPQSLAVVAAETKVDFLTLKATYITSQSCNFTAAESSEVVQALASQIGPIQASLDALKAKAQAFKKSLEAPIVKLDLEVLKKHTDGLINAITQKVTPDQAGLLSFGSSILDTAFDNAIAVY